jgi:hypothetical protein
LAQRPRLRAQRNRLRRRAAPPLRGGMPRSRERAWRERSARPRSSTSLRQATARRASPRQWRDPRLKRCLLPLRTLRRRPRPTRPSQRRGRSRQARQFVSRRPQRSPRMQSHRAWAHYKQRRPTSGRRRPMTIGKPSNSAAAPSSPMQHSAGPVVSFANNRAGAHLPLNSSRPERIAYRHQRKGSVAYRAPVIASDFRQSCNGCIHVSSKTRPRAYTQEKAARASITCQPRPAATRRRYCEQRAGEQASHVQWGRWT